MTKLHDLADLGQSVWMDYVSRAFIQSGELQNLINIGLRGLTSNPTIFEKAIAHSPDYDAEIARLAGAGAAPEEVFTSLAVSDLQQAADLFRPVFDDAGGGDGFVSLEVNPLLANDTQTTIDEALRLWERVRRPNLMIKIPATRAGLPAITAATAAGVNVNITLIFSLERYADVMAAYLSGLVQCLQANQPIGEIHSVASFFVSRVDTKVDQRLDQVIAKGGLRAELARTLKGRAAIANATTAYSQFKAFFSSPAFASLEVHGANHQRPLWASTSTKVPAYSDILYVQELIAPFTVNTMPQKTLEAFLDHGRVAPSLEEKMDEARFVLQSLDELGISMVEVTQELEDEGVAAFAKSFGELKDSLQKKSQELAGSKG